MITPCEIQSGKLMLDRDKLKTWCAVQKDGDYELYLTKKREAKTLKQLHLWWGIMLKQFMLHIGYDKHEVTQVMYCKSCHDALKSLYEPPQTVLNRVTGKETMVLWSMADASKKKVSDFMDWFVRYASQEHGFIFEEINL